MKPRLRVKDMMGLVVLAAFEMVAFKLVRQMILEGRSEDDLIRFAQLIAVMLFFATPFYLVGMWIRPTN